MEIEFTWYTPDQFLFGFNFLNAEAYNTINGDVENVKCIQIGFILFTISIFIKE